MITIRGLHKALGGRRVLSGVDADVAEGAIVALVGASGSGKTTLLRCLNGLERFDSGSVHIAGHELAPGARATLPPRLRCDVGLVFQEYHLFPHLDALDNVTLATRVVSRTPRDAAAAIGRDWLERVGLAGREHARPSELSGGEKQRVALARALAQGARVLLLDEPTSALDANNRDEIKNLLLGAVRKPKDRPLTLLVVTHDRGFAEALADEVWSLESGRIGGTKRPPTSPAPAP
jgi:ABC-type polar amino acid transport system ATPase subunit